MMTQTKTTRSLLDDEGNVLVEDLHVTPYSDDLIWRNGDEVAYLAHDEDGWANWEWPEGVIFEEFRSEWSRDDFIEAHTDETQTAFVVDKYDHGNVHFSLANTALYPDRRWDVAPSCVIVVPHDFRDPRGAAQVILDEYSKSCNGDVWGIVTINLATREEDACWGFIGQEYAEAEAQNWIGIKAPYPS